MNALVKKPTGPTAVSALQGALAAEHAAVYGYGVIGAIVTGKTETLARSDWLAHQEPRDTLEAMLVKLGATPVAATRRTNCRSRSPARPRRRGWRPPSRTA